MNNATIAEHLRQHARELDFERGNLLRVCAYRRAADMILELDEPLADLFEHEGRRGLEAIPLIGKHIAVAIESLLRTGTMPGKRAPASEEPLRC